MSELIVMLTNKDETVSNAIEVFEECRKLPVKFWGFKNIGLPVDKMKQLVQIMKKNNKTTFLEVVTLKESECMDGAKMAVDCGFDYLLGTVFFDSVYEFVKKSKLKYFPFCGKVHGHPSILTGSTSEIVENALMLQNKGVHGLDLLAYRHKENPELIIEKILKKIDIPLVVAGSIGDYPRLDTVQKLNPWAYTIGSALFDGKFSKDSSFSGQLEAVIEHFNKKTKGR